MAKVPLITGNNINGGAMFGWLFPLLWGDFPYPVQRMNLTKVAKWFLPNTTDQARFLKLYGGDDWAHGRRGGDWTIDRIDRFWRDSFFACPARETAMGWSKAGMPVYEYVFSFAMHTNVSRIIHAIDSTHGFELPFVFRNSINTLGELFLEPRRYHQMSDIMSCTWASFIKCQKPKCDDPNTVPNCANVLAKVPEWPAFQPENRQYISFKAKTTVESIKSYSQPGWAVDEFPGDDRCDFWKTADLSWQSIRTWPSLSEKLQATMEKNLEFSVWSDPMPESEVAAQATTDIVV